MKLLIDTNVFIPLEPTHPSQREALTESVTRLARLASESGFQTYLHPAARADLDRDKDLDRSRLRHTLFSKYPAIPDPPPVTARLEGILGKAAPFTNNWVDHQLIAALDAEAVDFLVTEDQKLLKKARRAGLGSRVYTVPEAIGLIETLSDRVPSPPPAVRPVKSHAIEATDPILDSFRDDYPEFDNWFSKCRRQHRQAWIIEGPAREIAAFCIVNPEKDALPPLTGKVLKLCSFKVSERYSGARFGELLLKAVLDHAVRNHYDWIYVTVFDKHERLIDLFETFGFSRLDARTSLGELILAKPARPDLGTAPSSPLPFHIRYGPRFFRTDVPWFVVPIQPRYARVLFPESAEQRVLHPGAHPFGNAIRKAYLCRAPIRTLSEGCVLLFYRSSEDRGGIALGIVEETLVSSSPEELARVVGKRTVYSLKEIEQMCSRPVLAILFRQARVFEETIPTQELVRQGLFKRPPQSIMTLEGGSLEWLKQTVMA
jgi:L-amino acid N-acyltransferase YncA